MRLKDSESLYLDRKRRGETQEEAAARRRVNYRLYIDWELGRAVAPWYPHVVPQEGEICEIRRRRAGLTQEEVGDRIGITKAAVGQMEKGIISSHRLEKFWRAYNS